MNNTKPGFKTSEFFIILVVMILETVAMMKNVIDPNTYVILISIKSVVYTIMRTLIKNPDITTIIEKIENKNENK